MTTNILHIDLDAFFASVEQVRDPTLRGRPVIVGGNPDGRGVVSAASYEARAYGVHSAMPMARAKRLCPGAVFLRGDHRLYGAASRAVMRILRDHSPCVEPVSIDEAVVDLGGLRRLFGPPVDVAERIRREIHDRLRLSASLGLSTNRLVSKIASDYAKPGALVRVDAGCEARFLAPLPIGRLPGVGKKMEERLNDLGLYAVGDLAALDRRLVERAFGAGGLHLYRSARGEGHVTFREERRPLSISRETTFDADTADRDRIEGTLVILAERAGRALRRTGMSARTVTVRIRYGDFRTVSGSARLTPPAAEDPVIFSSARATLTRVWSRRVRIRRVGISLSGFLRMPGQIELFPRPDEARERALGRAIDEIRERFGFAALARARALMAGGGRNGGRTVYPGDPRLFRSPPSGP